jgi:hypothetical protein
MHMVLNLTSAGSVIHHDRTRRAIVSGRRDDEVDMACNRPAGLADEQAPNVVVIAFEGQLLGHHRVARRWKHAAGDHVALLTFRVAADYRDDSRRHHEGSVRVCFSWLDQCD